VNIRKREVGQRTTARRAATPLSARVMLRESAGRMRKAGVRSLPMLFAARRDARCSCAR